MICFIVLSVNVAFAANETNVDETNDQDVDNEAISVDDEVLASNSNDDTVATNQNGGEVFKDSQSNVVTNDTFYNYFDNSGTLLANVTSDELIFEGNFSNVGGNNLIINKSITLTGNNATLNGFSVVISSDNVSINGFKIISRNTEIGIKVENANNVEIKDNHIDVVTKDNCDSYGIYANLADNIKLINNSILFVGITTWDGDEYKNCVKISSSKNALIKDNSFDITVPSCVVGWLEIPPGSGNWVGVVITGGIVIDSCEDLKFQGNDIKLNYNDVVGLYDTIYVVNVKNSANAVLSDNEIDANGCSYIYGIVISGENFIISDNVIKTSSDYYHANGIDIEGPASGVVENNNITCTAPTAVYPIYSAMSNGNVSVNYTGNNITGEGYFVCGMEVAGTNEFISNNVIDVKGNYTIGIGSAANELVAEENVITLDASNIGYEYVWDDLGVETAAIKINKGNALINANTIVSNAIGIKAKQNNTNIVKNNITIANITGDGYAIYAYDLSSLNIEGNEVHYVGSTEGLTINYALYALNCTNASICDNTFDISIPSCAVDWREIPPGTGNWVGVAVSEGIVIESCDGLKFSGNDIELQYTDVVGYYDTIYVVDVSNSTNAVLSDNKIDAKGYTYIYGILISGDNFTIDNNQIKTISDDFYANGIDIEGPATGVVKNNIINTTAPTSAYPIYSAMSNGNVSVNYTNNWLSGKAYFVCGMEIAGTEANIEDSIIIVSGNYSIGIGSVVDNLTVSNNAIVAVGSNVGDEEIWDDLGVETAGIKINMGNATFSDNNIYSNGVGAKLSGDTIILQENSIVVESGISDSYAIYASEVENLTIDGNTVNFIGSTDGYVINNALYAFNCSDASIVGNKFNISIPSCAVAWFEIPPGSGNWVGIAVSEGVVIDSCDGLKFSGNEVKLNYTTFIGDYDTIYVVDVKNSTNAILSNNTIDANGYSYIYGILISGENFTIAENEIKTSSDAYHANGIDIEGPASGVVKDNIINTAAPFVAYPIYSAMSNGNVTANYTGNTINGEGYFVCGMELAGVESNIENNEIVATGNYTIGIGSVSKKLNVKDNTIKATGSNVGNLDIWDDIGVDTMGIKVVSGEATIVSNDITTTGNYTVGVSDTTSSVHDNHLLAIELFGDASVNFTGDAEVYNNTPTTKSQLSGQDVTFYSGNKYQVLLVDGNGTAIPNALVKITVCGKTYNRTTDENGVASLPISLNANSYVITANYLGNDTFTPSSCEHTVTVLTTIKADAMTRGYNSGMDFKATFLDSKGKALANKKVSFIVDNKEYSATTDSKGVAKLNAKLAPGSYTVTSVNPVTGQKLNKKLTIVKRLQNNKDITMDYHDGTYYKVRVFGDDGKPVAGEVVKITVCGKSYYCKSDSNGYSKLQINLLPKTHKITAEYKGEKVTNNIVIKQVLKASSVTKKKAKSYPFSATLKHSDGKAISGKTVSFTINGKTYSAATNSKGVATVNINQALNAGKYAVVVKYIETTVKANLIIQN